MLCFQIFPLHKTLVLVMASFIKGAFKNIQGFLGKIQGLFKDISQIYNFQGLFKDTCLSHITIPHPHRYPHPTLKKENKFKPRVNVNHNTSNITNCSLIDLKRLTQKCARELTSKVAEISSSVQSINFFPETMPALFTSRETSPTSSFTLAAVSWISVLSRRLHLYECTSPPAVLISFPTASSPS